MNFNKIIDLINDNTDLGEFAWAASDLEESDFSDLFPKEVMSQLGTIEVLVNERQNDVWKIVLHFLEHDVYMALDGAYDSQDGCDFTYTTPYEVAPQQKMITVYTKVKK